MMQKRILRSIGCFLFLAGAFGARGQSVSVYVSPAGNDRQAGTISKPAGTLQHAWELARRARSQHPGSPVNVILRAGTYYLDSTLVLTADSGGGNALLTFEAYRNEKVTISGGRRLHLNWRRAGDGIYSAKVPFEADFDQLFVNGVQQVRARYPNYDASAAVFNGVSRAALSSERAKGWADPEGGYVHALQRYHWGSVHYRITGKDAEGRLQLEGGYQINRMQQMDSSAVFVENIREELDTVHEWYYDKQRRLLYFMPPAGMDLRRARIEVPVLTELMVFKGDAGRPVRNIRFRNITFTHTLQTFMFTREPLLRGDWNIFRGGAVLLSGTERCRFDQCRFESLGGNAILFSNYNRYDTIRSSLIRNTGASGICFVGDPTAVRSPSFNYDQYVPYDRLDKQPGPGNDRFPRDCFVYDNLICRTGRIEKQTAGVQLSMCMNIGVVHNTIYHVPRAGINVNDGTWGGHLIAGNDVFETVLETGDHGAFNSWGRDRYWSPDRSYMDSLAAVRPELIRLDIICPVTIRHNRFRCDHGWDIDLDDGSSNYVIDSNLCLNGGIKLREGFYREVKNNIMVNNTFHPHVWFRDSRDRFMHNIVMKPYAPIQVKWWGDTIDYNLFPDEAALQKARAKGTDVHSIAAFPRFADPSAGNYRLQTDSIIKAIGFRNFSMDSFGVVSPRLKAMAPQPVFPQPQHYGQEGQALTFTWRGAVLKEVKDINEQSALGLAKAEGVYISALKGNGSAAKAGFRKNDVILEVEQRKVRNISDFQQLLLQYKSQRSLHFTIYRDQRERQLTL